MAKFSFDKTKLKTALVVAATVVASTGLYSMDQVKLLYTSVVGLPEHAPFDGTVYPIKKVPNWVKLTTDEYKKPYSQIPSSKLQDIPVYNPDDLKISTDDLVWGNAAHDQIRNEKITYSVPYMGDYKLDGLENAGSHVAVDIKVPEGTPVYAIANGVVVKSVESDAGFGNHIVVQHNNFPTLDSASANKTIYSSYSHLSKVLVEDKQVVKKGEQIGLTGETGTATTPHLHFQIDNDSAPWHPYWPFDWKDQQEAGGLSFFEAINAGLGADKGRAATINPLKYVQKYLDTNVAGSYVVASDSNDEEVEEEQADNQEDLNEDSEAEVEEEVQVEEEEPTVQKDPPVLNFTFSTRPTYVKGESSNFSVLLRDQYGEIFKDGFNDEITVASANGKATVKDAIVNSRDFDQNGRLQTEFRRMNEGRDRIKITYNGESYYSDWFQIVEDGDVPNFTDVSKDHQNYEAITYLAQQGIVKGYSDGSFKPDQTVSRVEALKFIYEGVKESLSSGDLKFKDASRGDWYGAYLYTAVKNGVVSGYNDGTFKPNNTVSRAEFLKMLFKGMRVEAEAVSEDPADDVSKNDWFAPYIAKAKSLGIIDSFKRTIRPNEGMSRAEVAEAIYRLMTVVE